MFNSADVYGCADRFFLVLCWFILAPEMCSLFALFMVGYSRSFEPIALDTRCCNVWIELISISANCGFVESLQFIRAKQTKKQFRITERNLIDETQNAINKAQSVRQRFSTQMHGLEIQKKQIKRTFTSEMNRKT